MSIKNKKGRKVKKKKKLVIRYHYNEDPNAPELQEILESAFIAYIKGIKLGN